MKLKNLMNPVLKTILISAVLVGLRGSLFGCTGKITTTTTAMQTTTTTKTTTTATTASNPTTTISTTTATTTAAVPKPANPEIILSSTTSVRDSGLMDLLLPLFEKETGYVVKPIYNGSGAAIALGQAGQADVLVVHSPDAELQLVADGYGINRTLFTDNSFILVGPKNDPAGIKGMTSVVAAFKAIAASQSLFYSRGDASGTDTKEKAIWKTAGITQKGQSWYVEANTGMGDLLRIASEKGGYTLTDRATYITQQSTLSLDVMVQNDYPTLVNLYHVIEINPGAFPTIKINSAGAKAFRKFLVSPEIQQAIATYGVDKYGVQLFFADAGKTEASFGSK